MNASDPKAYLSAVEEIAREAGAVLMKHFRQLKGYDKKGAIDLQTIADREAEATVVASIQKHFPDHAILGEEGGRAGNPDSDYLWIADPLDGTTNYAHGLRIFATSLGLTHRGVPVAGAVFAPALDEMYLAAKGSGATRNGEVLRVSSAETLDDALLVTGFPYNRRDHVEALTGMHREVLARSRGVLRMGAAALDLAHIAAGNLDGYYEYGLYPWDMAAGALLVQEAGGTLSGLLEGEEFDLFTPRLMATNGRIHKELLAVIRAGGAEKMPYEI